MDSLYYPRVDWASALLAPRIPVRLSAVAPDAQVIAVNWQKGAPENQALGAFLPAEIATRSKGWVMVDEF